jgi:2,4-dienoyl-CoA reductase-like NADH-dependent reductase (Old Yellow Enzyme family)
VFYPADLSSSSSEIFKLANFFQEFPLSTHQTLLTQPLTLPCGATIKNRLAKSAMSENMASESYAPTEAFSHLYGRWARGGIGLCITGNIMVDETALGEPRNVVLGKSFDAMDVLTQWAQAGTQNQTALWAQLNHPGKQSPKFLSKTPVAPSAIAFPAPMNKVFNSPRELTDNEILDIIKAFQTAARWVKQAGFSGVQIHGAHGYLVSQFLSPRHNQRTDRWGGSIENRMRFVIEIYKAIRHEVGPAFPIGIKLNSSDFQKGGFTEEDSLATIKALDTLGIDLIEVSGGTYEAAAMTGKNIKGIKKSTLEREAYFMDFTQMIRSSISCPIMLTGGFRTRKGIESALADGSFDMVGLARSLAMDPEIPIKLIAGEDYTSPVVKRTTGFKFIDNIAPLEIVWYAYQLVRMGKRKDPVPNLSDWWVIVWMIAHAGVSSLRRTRSK